MARIGVIPGNGIANEVIPEAVKVLRAVDDLFRIKLEFEFFDFGAGPAEVLRGAAQATVLDNERFAGIQARVSRLTEEPN